MPETTEAEVTLTSLIKDNAVEVVEDSPLVDTKTEVEHEPLMEEEDWSDYVLKQFGEEELMDGNPTVVGLRRVTRKLLGDIFLSECRVVQSPSSANEFCATVEHKIGIRWKRETYGNEREDRFFTEVADVNSLNTDPEYRRFASATASTRAEGRALRKALMLGRVVAAEELTTVAPIMDTTAEQGKINQQQINFFNNIGKRANIHLMKFINMGKNKVKNVRDIPYDTAQKMIAALSKFAQNPSKRPESIVGWTDSWETYWDKAWDVKDEIQSATK